MEAVKPKPKLKKKPTDAGRGKGKNKSKVERASTVQQASGAAVQQTGGASVVKEVLNQAKNSEEPATTEVKSDPHSTCQDSPKTDSHSKPSTTDAKEGDSKQSEDTQAVAKETDSAVKSRPLSLNEHVSRDSQPDSAMKNQTSLLGKATESSQTAGTTQWEGATIPAEKQDDETKIELHSKLNIASESKIDSTPSLKDKGHKTKDARTSDDVVEGSKSLITADSATTSSTLEAASQPRPLTSDDHAHESTREQEVGVVSPELVAAVTEIEVAPSAPPLIDFCDEADQVAGGLETNNVASVSAVATASAEVTEESNKILYPRLDSIMREQEELLDEMQPFSEEDLALLYPNPQLDNQSVMVDTFISMSNQEHHELYELLMSYLKAIQALSNSQKHIDTLKDKYNTHRVLLWSSESRQITSNGRCQDGTKVSHSHSYKFATFNQESASQVNAALKETREILQEELCMHAYSTQLARIHIEHYLFQLMQSYPELNGTAEDAPPTSWVPNCPPGAFDSHNSRLRDCISVLFMFIRRPVVNTKFSDDCRHWLDILLSALLRVATLTDHQFIFNHLLRSPPGVGKWGAPYLHLLSPLQSRQLLQAQYQNRAPPLHLDTVTMDTGYTHDWGVGLGLHGDWGGPVLDHFVTMLATLLLPIKERDAFLPDVGMDQEVMRNGTDYSRSISQPWVFVEDTEEDEADLGGDISLLRESDFIAFFDQFPFTDLYQYILTIPQGGEYSVHSTSSHQMLRLLAFCTCLIRLLGAAFSTLKLARYKEFIKRVGRTIRQTVQYVADHWVTYKSHRMSCGDTMASLPPDVGHGDPRYSLNRLQLEFDQFVLRATKWILTAHKLGAWQFLADMPYGSISLQTAWMIFWNIYCKDQLAVMGGANQTIPLTSSISEEDGYEVRGQSARIMSPAGVEEIQDAIRGGHFKDQFVDRLMKTYTSEAVFLLTTLVNMARARPADSDQEREFINTIVLEIYECTHVVEYARDTYSHTGSSLLGSIAIVHPFIISTLLRQATAPSDTIKENCILLFKELPLHLWLPESDDMHVLHNLLTEYPLNSCENLLARVILSGLNWGTKSEEGSSELVLPWSLHCSVSLVLVEAHSKLLPAQPGGRDYVPHTSSLRNYATRFTITSEQQEFSTWAWEVVLMLKLHPNQLLSRSMQTLHPDGEQQVDERCYLSEPSWVHINEGRDEIVLPDLTSSGERELADLRDAVKYEGLLAYYVAMCVTSIGTDTDHFIASGLSMVNRLIDQGYYLPALRILANCTPQLYKHSKILVEDSNFPQIVMAIANADLANATFKERWTFSTPTPLVAKKMAALLQMQMQGACRPGGVGGETVLKFWLDILLSWPTWVRDKSILLLLDTLCMSAFNEPAWQKIIMDRMMENYRVMDPTQPKRSILSSVYSSVASIVGQDGSPPSIFNAVPHGECSWLAYTTLSAEQQYEEDEGIWRALLQQLRQDPKITVETALKRAFADLKTLGGFPANYLCIYRWAEFCTEIDHTHPLYSLIWQRFFMLYLQRPKLDDSSMPERDSFGIRFFASTKAISIRRQMKNSLSTTCKKLQCSINDLERESHGGERRDLLRTFLPKLLKLCQTFRLWLEEPRLHTAALYLPGLPQQYDSDRLVSIFQADKTQLWTEFVPLWEIRAEQNRMVSEWIQVADYQKPLRSKAYPPESTPDTAVVRMQKRLLRHATPITSPPFRYCSAPFSLLTPDLLVSHDSLLAVAHTDVEYLKQLAKSFCTKVDALTVLDEAYESAVPQLYTNEPRQFHVRVPCRPGRFSTSQACTCPATIIFRFNEMTINQRWDEQIQVNRSEYNSMMHDLCTPISKELCPIILRMEHMVTELSKLSDQNQGAQINVPLQCGIALFYKIIDFITPEIRRFPPTCQVLTTCLQLLGQEFIGRDALQTTNLLELLLTQHGKSDLIVPLFQPNLCPDLFVQMYVSAAEICAKEGPTTAFTVLTKFNITEWVESCDPSIGERTQLLDFINQGLTLYGKSANSESQMLVEVYRRHFIHLVEYKFPDLYTDALQILISGTDNAHIILNSWDDLCTVVCSDESPESCKLGLQQTKESIQILSTHYSDLRKASEQTLYSLLSKEYVPLIGKFIELLCIAMATKWKMAITEETAKHAEAVTGCWKCILDVFTPWIGSLPSSSGSTSTLPPCLSSEIQHLVIMMNLFVNCVSKAHSYLRDPAESVSIMGFLWQHYCNSIAQLDVARYLLSPYHSALEKLPWSMFFPDLAAMDSMMKLKLMERTQSFIFLGQVFPLFDWKTIAAAYSDVERHRDSSLAVQFHIMFLQVLLMLTADSQVMETEGTGMPELIAEAHFFHWEFIDAKTYQDILNWQKTNCVPSSILQTGSCLSLSLRLLKAAAGFPTSSGPKEISHSDTWEKRLAYLQVVVELIAACSERSATHEMSYAEPISHLFETAVDIAVQEPSEIGGANMLSTLQEILNLLNICSQAGGMPKKIMNVMYDIMDQMSGIHVLALTIITAGCKVLAAIPMMVVVVEHTIDCFFSNNFEAPQSTTLELPPDLVNGYGWKFITGALCLPEDLSDEVYQNCISESAMLIMHAQLMQDLPKCTSLSQEFGIAVKMVQWCTQLKPVPTAEAKIFLMWEKALNLLIRQVRFVGNHYELVPHFTALATSMIRFGEDKATDGILGMIGLGKKNVYSHKFRLISRAMAAFLHCQMPVDNRQTTLLRILPNSPGHIKENPKQQTFSVASATKQGIHTCSNLEALLTDKHYASLREHSSFATSFVINPTNNIMNCVYLLVSLSTALYPEARYLDVLRVIQML